jgi:flagellar operon protein (TIGR03826 family)
MPDVRNCRKCGKIFNYLGGNPICPVCKQLDEDDFKRVKEYLYDNPGSSMLEVSKALDVSVEKIKRFLKEGRLEIIGDDGNLILECESCGKSIKSGRFCVECEKNLTKELSDTAQQMNHAAFRDSEASRESGGLKYLGKTNLKPGL